jgi:hypothetical protein
MFNNLIAENRTATAGGIYIQNSPGTDIINCTVTANAGTLAVGGVVAYNFTYADVRNTIVYGNDAPLYPNMFASYDDSFAVSYSDIEGGWEGVGNLDQLPFFATGPLGDYYLSQNAAGQIAQSPAVDAGDSLAAQYYLDTLTTRTDQVSDDGFVDLGFHYFTDPHSGSIDPSDNPWVPSAINLQAYPNPFNSSTHIYFTLPAAAEVELVVTDILGRQVAKLAHDSYPAGSHRVSWSGEDSGDHEVASGVYLIQLITPQQTRATQVLFLK